MCNIRPKNAISAEELLRNRYREYLRDKRLYFFGHYENASKFGTFKFSGSFPKG